MIPNTNLITPIKSHHDKHSSATSSTNAGYSGKKLKFYNRVPSSTSSPTGNIIRGNSESKVLSNGTPKTQTHQTNKVFEFQKPSMPTKSRENSISNNDKNSSSLRYSNLLKQNQEDSTKKSKTAHPMNFKNSKSTPSHHLGTGYLSDKYKATFKINSPTGTMKLDIGSLSPKLFQENRRYSNNEGLLEKKGTVTGKNSRKSSNSATKKQVTSPGAKKVTASDVLTSPSQKMDTKYSNIINEFEKTTIFDKNILKNFGGTHNAFNFTSAKSASKRPMYS